MGPEDGHREPGALLFDRFWRKLVATVATAQLWKVPFDPADPVRTPHTINTAAPGVTAALGATVAELTATGIALDAPLGENQFVERGGKRIPIHGGTESLGVWNKVEPVWNAAGGGCTEVSTGSSYLQAVGWDGSRCPVARTLDVQPVVEPLVALLQRPDAAVLGQEVGELAVLRAGHPHLAEAEGGVGTGTLSRGWTPRTGR